MTASSRLGGEGGAGVGESGGPRSVAVVGLGVVGRRVAERLLRRHDLGALLLVDDDPRRRAEAGKRLRQRAELLGRECRIVEATPGSGGEGDRASRSLGRLDAVALCVPGGVGRWSRPALEAGAALVVASPLWTSLLELEELDAEARERGVAVVAGAGPIGGLDLLVARACAARLDVVEDVRLAAAGWAGPGCRAEQEEALRRGGVDRIAGGRQALPPRGGAGIWWFPAPLGPLEASAADLLTSEVGGRLFPTGDVRARLAPRVGRGRRLGGLLIEVRGRRAGVLEVRSVGVVDDMAALSAVVVCGAIGEIFAGRLGGPGTVAFAERVVDPGATLGRLVDEGVRLAEFDGLSDPLPGAFDLRAGTPRRALRPTLAPEGT